MLPIRWDPIRELSSLHREMDDLFRRTFGTFAPGRETAGGGTLLSPPVNTFVKGDTFHLQAEIPGVRKEDLDVTVEGNVLTLKGERKQEKETREENYYLRESRHGSFLRRLTLPEGVNTEKVHASYDDGILEITMPMEKRLATGRKVLIEGTESSKKEPKKVH